MSSRAVTRKNLHLPVGMQLQLTGRVNGVQASECVKVGHFEPGYPGRTGYQHSKDGQIIWINNAYLERITATLTEGDDPEQVILPESINL